MSTFAATGASATSRARGEACRRFPRETPTEILDRRLAEGAISVQDYHERREVIGN